LIIEKVFSEVDRAASLTFFVALSSTFSFE